MTYDQVITIVLWVIVLILVCKLPFQRVPFYESMTKRQLVTGDGGIWTVRVWRRAETLQLTSDPEVWTLLTRQWSSIDVLAGTLAKLKGVAAFEVLMPDGIGGVVYLEWP